MTSLSYAVVNWLSQQPSVVALVGANSLGPWIFAERPEATIENTGQVMIVVTVDRGWGANNHNTARFPVVTIDIWADPTRNPDRSVRKQDASLKVEAVYKEVDKFLHLVSPKTPGGGGVYWGTPTEVATKTGIRINSSSRNDEPELRPAIDDQGAMVGRVTYSVSI